MNTPKQQIGELGEAIAKEHLIQEGYEVIATNWRYKRGEIDVIAKKEELLVFIEIKTRRANDTDTAMMNFTPQKRQRIVNAVYAYLEAHRLPDANWRLDLIAIALPYQKAPLIQHSEDCLEW